MVSEKFHIDAVGGRGDVYMCTVATTGYSKCVGARCLGVGKCTGCRKGCMYQYVCIGTEAVSRMHSGYFGAERALVQN